jgi:hypothetical protein
MNQSGRIASPLLVLFSVGLLWLVGGLGPVDGPANEGQTPDVSRCACWFCGRRARQMPNIRAPSEHRRVG